MEPNPYEAPKEEGHERAQPAPSRPDLISTLATIAVPAYLIVRLLTGGWTFIALLLIVFAAVMFMYWRLGFFADTD